MNSSQIENLRWIVKELEEVAENKQDSIQERDEYIDYLETKNQQLQDENEKLRDKIDNRLLL